MERKYKNLCRSLQVGRVWFRNRMFSTPMGGTDIENDGCIGPKSTAFYEYRAKGGAAAVTVSELMVHPSTDGSHAYHLDESILLFQTTRFWKRSFCDFEFLLWFLIRRTGILKIMKRR